MRAHTEHHQSDLSLVPRFDASRLLPRYRHSRRRLLLVDFEGTAWLRDMSREGLLKPFEPPEDAMALFERLVGDRRNEVWALSGLPVKDVLEKVAERVPGLGIV
jgi:trehalose-6-phosphatase